MQHRILAITIGVLFVVMTSAVITSAYAAAHRIPSSSLPYEGFPVRHAEIAARLPNGGVVLIISESCATARVRLPSVVRLVESSPDHLLLVIGSGRFPEVIRHLERSRIPAERILMMSSLEAYDALNVMASPSMVQIGENGRVIGAVPATVGWMRPLTSPEAWKVAWRRR